MEADDLVRFIYQLRIDVKRIRPPIWRRLRVPGNLVLGDLHIAIQAAFNWGNYHLHEFKIKDKVYVDPEILDDVYRGELDEWEHHLQNIGLQEKDKFLYVYDFGDHWIHQIKVEKIVPMESVPPDELDIVVCLTGRRAAPPEDCEGVSGYENLCEIMNTQIELLGKEELDLREWAGDFEPEAINLEEINARIKTVLKS